MNFNQALVIVQEVGANYGLPGLLETLEFMQSTSLELSDKELRAYRVVFNEMGKLFAPA